MVIGSNAHRACHLCCSPMHPRCKPPMPSVCYDGASTLQAFMPPAGDGLRVAHRVGRARAADLEVRAAAPVRALPQRALLPHRRRRRVHPPRPAARLRPPSRPAGARALRPGLLRLGSQGEAEGEDRGDPRHAHARVHPRRHRRHHALHFRRGERGRGEGARC